jgi:hypothetical protein
MRTTMPMTAMTIIISIRVKPVSELAGLVLCREIFFMMEETYIARLEVSKRHAV